MMTLEISGKQYGRLRVIGRLPMTTGARKASMWKCRCDCGGEIAARGSALTGGNTRSCGCLVRDKMAETGRKNGTHRLSRTPEYRAWSRMIHRCYNEKDNRFQYYGARGIAVCEAWLRSFETFLADMGNKPTPKHSIDRFPDTNGNYEPGNCRWATASQQNKNRRPFKRSKR